MPRTSPVKGQETDSAPDWSFIFSFFFIRDYSLDGSCIGDYLLESSPPEGGLGGVKRRGGSSPFRKSSPEEGNSEDDESSPRESKIRKRSSPQFNFHYLDVTSEFG